MIKISCPAHLLPAMLLVGLFSLTACELRYAKSMCESDSLGSYTQDAKITIQGKRDELKEVTVSAGLTTSKKMEKELDGLDAHLQMIHDDGQAACLDWAICQYRSSDTNSCSAKLVTLQQHRESARNFYVQTKSITADHLKEKITLQSFARGVNAIDQIYFDYLNYLGFNVGVPRSFSVGFSEQGDKLVQSRNGSVLRVIGGQDLRAKLKGSDLEQINTYEDHLSKLLAEWQKVYPQRGVSPDAKVNAEVETRLQTLANNMKQDLLGILDYLMKLGFLLDDHYLMFKNAVETSLAGQATNSPPPAPKSIVEQLGLPRL